MSEEISESRLEAIQKRLTSAVVGDQTEEKINQIISANKLDEAEASQLLKEAKRKRLDIIRGVQMRKVRLGCFVMILGVAALYLVKAISGRIDLPIFCIAGFILAMGGILLLLGLFGIIFAGSKRGCFLEEM